MKKASGIISFVKYLFLQSFSVNHIKQEFGNKYTLQVRHAIIQINLNRMISVCAIIALFELITTPCNFIHKLSLLEGSVKYIGLISQLFLFIVSIAYGIIGVLFKHNNEPDHIKSLRLYLSFYLCVSVGCLCYIYSDIIRGASSNTIYYLAMIIATIPIYTFKEALFFIILNTSGVLGIILYHGNGSFTDNLHSISILLVSWVILFHLRTYMYRIMYNKYRLEDRNKSLDTLTKIDPLTNLPNRRALDEYVKEKLGCWKEHNKKVMILMLDIDNFKNYNDTFSHLDGDDCLNAVAQAIVKKLNEYPELDYILARTGGEEFISIIENWKTEKEILDICIRINKSVEEMHLVSGEGSCHQYVTVSIGCAIYDPMDTHNEGENPVNAQFRIADYELYNAKKEGKNRVSFRGKIINQFSEMG